MTSCGGTSMVMVLRSILTILSTKGSRMKSPGPLGPPVTRPRRKMTPRSYSLTILMALIKTVTTNMAIITSTMAEKPIAAACTNARLIRSYPSSVAAGPKGPDPPDCTTGGAASRARKRGRLVSGLPLLCGYGFRSGRAPTPGPPGVQLVERDVDVVVVAVAWRLGAAGVAQNIPPDRVVDAVIGPHVMVYLIAERPVGGI